MDQKVLVCPPPPTYPPSPSAQDSPPGVFLGLYIMIYMYYTLYITSTGSAYNPGYLILIGATAHSPTLNYQPPTASSTGIITSLTLYIMYLRSRAYHILISILDPILKHPLLLPPAPNCMHVHQFCIDYSETCFLVLSIVHLHSLYNI